MHDLSFTPRNVYFDHGELRLSVEIFTFNNIYTADPERTSVGTRGFFSSGLLTSGGQQPAAGSLYLEIEGDRACVGGSIEGQTVRCIKLAVEGLPEGYVDGTIDCLRREVDDFGFVLHYPEGWRELATPLTFLNTAGGVYYFYSEDERVREKRFAFMRRSGGTRAELIFEEDATAMSSAISAPAWHLGFVCNEQKGSIQSRYAAQFAAAHGLVEYNKRPDVPAWLRDISLVIGAHCMHWTGYVFNKYEDIIPLLDYVCERIDGKHVLLYLPGFEGRYYYDYGNYSTSPALGGDEGMHRLVEACHTRGVHVMPFFGINVVSTESEGYAAWGAPSQFVPAAGGVCNHLDCDMDSARHYHHGSQGQLNPAAPLWQNRLVSQITAMRDKFGFDGVFLDIAAIWVNDAQHPLFPGVKRLCERLRESAPEFVVSGEAWYDGLAECMPLFHSGHTFGRMHYHDEFCEELFVPYCREFAHLCLGDPSRHSTGVHELGTNHTWRAPVRRGVIPTLTAVDTTLAEGKEGIDAIIADAITYRDLYVN